MRTFALTAALGAACLGLAACADREEDRANTAAATGGEAAAEGETAGRTETAATFPRGSRIVVEDGVTFRVDPDGTRVRLGEGESRIVVEDDVRFRVDPDGTRVRIGPDGAELEVRDDDIDARVRTDGRSIEVNTGGR